MKFLSDILAKAGLTVDGVVTLNNTATGQTPAANDNSTKLATTAWVRGFVTPYTLPIASGTTLGGIKIGSGLSIDGTGIVSVAASGVGAIRALQQITATAGQTVFTVSGGYTPGLIDVFLNGVLITPNAIDISNGNTFTLADAAVAGDLLDIFVYNPIYNGFISSTDQVPEGTINLYYTNARARAAITLTVTGTSGASTYNSGTGVLNIPTYTLAGLGGVPTGRTITIDGVAYDLSADRIWNILPTGGAAGDILAKNSATNYDVAWIPNYTSSVKHTVKAAVALTKGQAVYVSSADGTNMIVSKASNTSEGTSSKTLGLIAQDLAINGQGFVVTEGLLAGLDTSTATAGDPVWLGTNGNLIFGLVNKPTAPAHLVFIGIVTRVQQNNGEIFVKVQNGFELDELHNLSVANASDGDMIKYVASTGLWTKIAATTTNITEGTNLYYTNARARAAISVTGSGSYDSATGVITVTGGVTSVNTLTGAVTLTTSNIAEGTNLYYTDARVNTYLTSNSYATQSYVSTQIANLVASAPATLDTLNELATALGNDPNFATTVSTSIGTKVPQSRTITINGTTYDLSANRSWTIASGVTSFNTRTGDIIPATGDYTTAQVAESGNLYFTTSRARTSISLTTTGTSGAATYDNTTGVLNIPQYQGGVTSFNTRTGAITLSSSDVTTALGFTPASSVSSSSRTIQTYTATANQTTFTVTGGYVVGLVDVYINGIKLATSDYTATNGTTIVLGTGTGVNNIVEVVRYNTAFTATNALRQITYFTATAGQTTFTVTYNPGLVDVFYNGSKLAASDYTASNGTSVVLGFAATLNDTIEVVAYSYAVGAYTGQAQLNGTGFVKVSGTTVSYDNSTYALDNAVVKLTGSQTIAGTKTFSSQIITDIQVVSPAFKVLNSGNASFYSMLLSYSNTTRIVALPDKDGTIAMTSDIPTVSGVYLPLSGGTLTGALSGTSANFTNTSGDTLTLSKGSGPSIQFAKTDVTAQTWALTGEGTAFKLYNYTSGTTPFQIATSGAATFSSSVSIGGAFNFPNGSISSTGELSFNSSAPNIYTYGRYAGTNAGRIIFNNGTGANLFFGELASNIYGFTAGGYNSTPGLTMDMVNYRVGIGTTSPIEPLSVSFAAHGLISQHRQSSGLGVGQNFYMKFNDANGSAVNYAGIYADIQANTAGAHSGRMILQVANAGSLVSALTIMNNGKVGIGQTSPAYTLDVNGSGRLRDEIWLNSSGQSSLVFQLADVNKYNIAYNTNGYLQFYNYIASNVAMVISGSSNIGIQTTSPVTALQVGSGTVSSIPSWMRIMTADTTQTGVGAVYNNKAIYVYNNGSELKLDAYDYSIGVGLDVRIGGNGGKIILQGGNVGINTTSPAEKLQVNGNICLNNGGYGWIYANDTNHSIIMRGDRNGNPADYTNYYQYGGTIASGKGHKFWTGGVLANQTLKFHIGDDYTYNIGNMTIGGTLTENSSIRYKENIETVKDGLDIILSLRGVTYNKKQTGTKELGLIAEEVESVLPDVVIKDAEGKPDSVAYARIVAVLVEAVKELKQEINVLNGKLNS